LIHSIGTWIHNDIFYYGWNDTFEINFISVGDSAHGVIRHDHDPVPVTQTELADPQDGNHPEFRELLAAYDHYDTKPAF